MPKKKAPPLHLLCAKAGHCCFDQAYMIGRLDERNGAPDLGKLPTSTTNERPMLVSVREARLLAYVRMSTPELQDALERLAERAARSS